MTNKQASMLSIYRKLESIKAKMAAAKEEQHTLEGQLTKGIRLTRIDAQGRRYGIKDGVRRLQVTKISYSFPEIIETIVRQLVPKTKGKRAEEIRKKLARSYTYSTFSRGE
ncbi:hypothetical protein ES703_69898 [subsurface metagenome]